MEERDVTLVGYCEPVSCRGGDAIDLKLSAPTPGAVTIDLVELICGDAANPATGFVEREVEVAGFPLTVDVDHQALNPGSYATFGPSPSLICGQFTIGCSVRPSIRPTEPQPVIQFGESTVWWGRDGFSLDVAGAHATGPLEHRRWYNLTLCSDADGTRLSVEAHPTHSPGRDSTSQGGHVAAPPCESGDLLTVGHGYDGRVAGLWMARVADANPSAAEFRWDASIGTGSRQWSDVGEHSLHGTLHQLPARAVRGPLWDSSSQNPATAPEHYDAVHFHTDDLYDAGWTTTTSLLVPPDLPSGVYCFRTKGDTGEDRTPFFVAAPAGKRAEIAFLAPVATYLAYANQRIHLTNAEFFAAGKPAPANPRWIRDNPDVGYSMYEYHSDRSGVMFSSYRRPVMNLKPSADTWGFTPDTNIVAFLHHLDVDFDIVSDEQLHAEGAEALDGYRVVVTGSHPEYYSTEMLDTLEAWQRDGGRLMYLGGNGFYWRVAFSSEWPGAMEVRRAEDGTRAWISEAGEYHHAFGGEYGGLWRRQGRAPNMICGVGFAAQGFGRGAPYQRTHDEPDRTDWIFDGTDGDEIGAHGIGGGAAGQEIDRYEVALGSPEHAVVIATSQDHDKNMLRTKEEFHVIVADASAMSTVRADMVFYEVDGGGAVFSTGSIAWFGALATNNYDNDVSRVTENVLRRFSDPAGF